LQQQLQLRTAEAWYRQELLFLSYHSVEEILQKRFSVVSYLALVCNKQFVSRAAEAWHRQEFLFLSYHSVEEILQKRFSVVSYLAL
jgi:transposase-like protein